MERKELATEIIDFCMAHKIKGFPKEVDIAERKALEHLEYGWFVENLIQTFLTKARYTKHIDRERLEALLAELEKVRLELGCLE